MAGGNTPITLVLGTTISDLGASLSKTDCIRCEYELEKLKIPYVIEINESSKRDMAGRSDYIHATGYRRIY